MSHWTVTVWRCLRCDREVTLGKVGEQPPGWRRLYIASPPESSEHASAGDFCPPCFKDVDHFMITAPPRAA